MLARVGICAGMVGGCLWWSGLVTSSTTTYNLPENVVKARVKDAGLPPFVFGSQPVDGVLHTDTHQVSWEVENDGYEVMRFMIDLTPVDDTHTEVHVWVKGPTDGKYGNVEARLQNDTTLRNLYAAAMKEQVDSVLLDHPFRYSAISGATAAATFAHMGQISASMSGGRKHPSDSSSN